MSTVYVNLTLHVEDSDDPTVAVNAVADRWAKIVGDLGAECTSASITSEQTGMLNLHDRHVAIAADKPAKTPREAGPASEGVGAGAHATSARTTKQGARSGRSSRRR